MLSGSMTPRMTTIVVRRVPGLSAAPCFRTVFCRPERAPGIFGAAGPVFKCGPFCPFRLLSVGF